jgi:cell division protein FtsQ
MGTVSRPARAQAVTLPLRNGGRARGVVLAKALPSGRALLLGFALLAAGGLAYVGARESALFALRSIQISGAPPRVGAHVRAALEPLKGRSLLALNQREFERRLAGLSDVADVSFDRDFPHTLRVFVTPAHSIAVLRRGASAWIVSSDGRVVRSADRFAARKLPRIWIPRIAAIDVGTTVGDADAARAIRALAIARGTGFGTRIAAVRSTDGELTFILAGGPELRFGDLASLPLKLEVARRLVGVARTSGYVDVTVPARPVAGRQP